MSIDDPSRPGTSETSADLLLERSASPPPSNALRLVVVAVGLAGLGLGFGAGTMVGMGHGHHSTPSTCHSRAPHSRVRVNPPTVIRPHAFRLDRNAKLTWLGVQTTEHASESGAAIAEVMRNSPAQQAGLKAGDRITAVGQKDIAGPRCLQNVIRSFEPGTAVELTVVRGKEKLTLPATLGETSQLRLR